MGLFSCPWDGRPSPYGLFFFCYSGFIHTLLAFYRKARFEFEKEIWIADKTLRLKLKICLGYNWRDPHMIFCIIIFSLEAPISA